MIISKQFFLINFIFIIVIIIIYIFPNITLSYNFLNEEKIKYDLQCIQQLDNININQKSIISSLQSALNFIEEIKISNNKIKEYQEIIDNFAHIALKLQEESDNFNDCISTNVYQNSSIHDVKHQLSQVYSQLKGLSNQLIQEKDYIQSIHESLRFLPQQQISIKNVLNNLEQQRYTLFLNMDNPLDYAKFTAFQAKQSANRLKVSELELAQLSAANRKELSKLRIVLLKKKYDYTNNLLQVLKNKLNSLYCDEINQEIDCAKKKISYRMHILPQSIQKQLKKNQNLLLIIQKQTHCMHDIDCKKKAIDTDILQVHQTFTDLIEQSQWVDKSPALGETLRAQVAKLPKIPKFSKLNHEMAQLRAKRLQYENRLYKLSTYLLHSKQDDGSELTSSQKNFLEKQLSIQRKLIILLINNYDIQILELTKLKLSYEQLYDSLQEIQQIVHRYLFWIADLHPMTISYFSDVYQDIYRLFNDKIIYYQILNICHIMYQNYNILILTIFFLIILLGLYFKARYHYYKFLERSSKYIGKVNQDNFLITFYNICSSIVMAMPIPILWIIAGYNLSHIWPHSISIAIGDNMYFIAFILWVLILSSYFASDKGLFIAHFGWSTKKIRQVFSNHYSWSIVIIILLITTLIIFDNYNHREFSNTLGRLCFILLCIYLAFITCNLRRSGFPLFLNKNDSLKNIINRFLWNVMIYAPIVSSIACIFGYLFAAQALLIRLETSLFIWSILLIIYYIIRRWMLIQRKRIAFKRAKKKRLEQLSLIATNKLISPLSMNQQKNIIFIDRNDKKNLDLDTISIRSLQLIRSVIILVALLLMTLLWSGLYSTFSFLENITLWDVRSTIKGVENIQPITLKTFLTMIVVITITTIMVRNFPAFLELTLLQRLYLTPGTGYAITTLTKYVLMLLGSLIGLSLIGIEWVKIQWLIAALGVGLGFGLQEIFANFISGLMILFEKPIRIGDTITIHNITGKVSRINTRATIITDWDHKEIIVPNKEFITKKFINWSLSDTITRVVLRIPTPLKIDIKQMMHVLMNIIKESSLALDNPASEIYLISVYQGLPIFEIRTYTANINLRIPLCHYINTSIIEYCKKNNLHLPCIPMCCCKDTNINIASYNYSITDLPKSIY